MGGLRINLLRADVAALPAEARSFLGAHHIVGVLGALPNSSPLQAEDILVLAPVTGTSLLARVFEGPHMDPFRGGPLLAFDDGAAPVQTVRVCRCIRVEAEEQQGVTFYGLYCIGQPTI